VWRSNVGKNGAAVPGLEVPFQDRKIFVVDALSDMEVERVVVADADEVALESMESIWIRLLGLPKNATIVFEFVSRLVHRGAVPDSVACEDNP
jgi:hypothetical protein